MANLNESKNVTIENNEQEIINTQSRPIRTRSVDLSETPKCDIRLNKSALVEIHECDESSSQEEIGFVKKNINDSIIHDVDKIGCTDEDDIDTLSGKQFY